MRKKSTRGMGDVLRLYWRVFPVWMSRFRLQAHRFRKRPVFGKRGHARLLVTRALKFRCMHARTESLRLDHGGKEKYIPADCVYRDIYAVSGLLNSGEISEDILFAEPDCMQTSSWVERNCSFSDHEEDGFTAFSEMRTQATARTEADEKVNILRSFIDKPNAFVRNGIPVVKYSFDPYKDFRDSMLEMLLFNGLKGSDDLEDLFYSYINLNSPENCEYIRKAFLDLLTELSHGFV